MVSNVLYFTTALYFLVPLPETCSVLSWAKEGQDKQAPCQENSFLVLFVWFFPLDKQERRMLVDPDN